MQLSAAALFFSAPAAAARSNTAVGQADEAAHRPDSSQGSDADQRKKNPASFAETLQGLVAHVTLTPAIMNSNLPPLNSQVVTGSDTAPCDSSAMAAVGGATLATPQGHYLDSNAVNATLVATQLPPPDPSAVNVASTSLPLPSSDLTPLPGVAAPFPPDGGDSSVPINQPSLPSLEQVPTQTQAIASAPPSFPATATIETLSPNRNDATYRNEPFDVASSDEGTPPENTVNGAADSLVALSSEHVAPPEQGDVPAKPERRTLWSGSADASGNAFSASSLEPALMATAGPAKHAPAVEQSAAIADQIKDAVLARWDEARLPGRTEIHVRLNPPELGEVRVHLISQAEQVSGRLVVQDDTARAALEHQLPELRQRLQDAGVTLGRFDLAHEGGGHWHPQQDPPASFAEPVERNSFRSLVLAQGMIPSRRESRNLVDLLA